MASARERGVSRTVKVLDAGDAHTAAEMRVCWSSVPAAGSGADGTFCTAGTRHCSLILSGGRLVDRLV